MSFSVDQFMQVKCSFQLTSESESSESIITNNEQIRLCTSVNLDDNNAALIVMVCTNETSNNHILAYYMERRQSHYRASAMPLQQQQQSATSHLLASASVEQSQAISDESTSKANSGAVTFANLAAQSKENPFRIGNTVSSGLPVKPTRRLKTKPRIIVKQIYYHDYNEDIVALCLSRDATKLILVNASSTVYVIPIKNILLNLHAQQLRSSQGRSMYFYDASILACAQSSFVDPVDVAHWESSESGKSFIILASHSGKLMYLDADEKRVVCSSGVGEAIKSLKVVRDKHSHSLLVTCNSLNQYRQVLELFDKNPRASHADGAQTVISLPPPSSKLRRVAQKSVASIDEQSRQAPSWSAKPLLIRPLSHQSGAASATNALQRVLLPSAGRFTGSQASLVSSSAHETRERSICLVGYQEPNLMSLVDVLGPNSGQLQAHGDQRLLRFYSDKQYSYQPARPQVICKLDSLHPDELITQLILTDRFLALTTDRDRCIVNSRNCCKLKSNFSAAHNHHQQPPQDLSPLVKEITFNHEEKIMLLVRSPAVNDPDNIIDSFLLVTTRSIYTIEARHGCRELFINLIDSHLAIKRTLFMSRPRREGQLESATGGPYSLGRMISSASENHLAFELNNKFSATASGEHGAGYKQHGYETRNAESNLLINSFLQHRDAYERVCHDSQAFSTLFKVELASLYEAYADRLLQRGQLELANRFFQMASFDHIRILGKYIRVGAHKETIDYVRAVLDDENDFRRVLGESERIELSKLAFECLLAKTIVERSKLGLYRARPSRSFRNRLVASMREQLASGRKQPPDIQAPSWTSPALRGLNPFSLCEHSPRGQDAKLSATTIVPGGQNDEETLTSNTGDDQRRATRASSSHSRVRLECEKNLLHFMRNLMPSSMFEYTIDQLLDFDLIEFIDLISQTEVQILSFIKMVIRYRNEDRLIFRAGRFEPLMDRLARVKLADLAKVSIDKEEFLEFLTSLRVTKALVKDIALTCEYYGYQHTRVQFRKFSYAAVHHLETYRQLIIRTSFSENHQSDPGRTESLVSSNSILDPGDDNANDGLSFGLKSNGVSLASESRGNQIEEFSEDQRRNMENIFIEFLTACLDESTEDSCRLWYSYVNFYLNHVGTLDELQTDIARMVEDTGDCRFAISLYRAIQRDELLAKGAAGGKPKKSSSVKSSPSNFKISRNTIDIKSSSRMSSLKEDIIANTPLEKMTKLFSLAGLFRNEFLMKLLDKTLDLMPQSADLNALNIANMC